MEGKKILLPGDHVGPGEVYAEGASTYTEKDEVYASTLGVLDEQSRGLKTRFRKIQLERGNIVYGIVLSVFENFAILGVMPEKSPEGRYAGIPDGKILVKFASKEYTRSMRDAFKVGDLVRAKVTDVDGDTAMLTTAYPEYGVIKAFCSRDKTPLEKRGKDLVCPLCKGNERRKLANDYRSFGKINL
ncbi:MAG: exosome complex RNA-binding protein Csl4 [Candidatus ainarchaeum sp.]|nr:exosome complex RNA-binding protein Csl4 [Candidatus ainarchaeum sp.]MDD5096468.1 exosome complex RNA-binding protein Csl4 [Candidatus ainarchaeum sp.]